MDIVVDKKVVGNDSLSTQEFKISEGKTILVASRKYERRVPVRKWFKVVGHKLVMCRLTTLAIIPQTITNEGFSFVVKTEENLTPFGNFTMVKNKKKGDIYILGKGENITFKTNFEGQDEEYIIKIKENK